MGLPHAERGSGEVSRIGPQLGAIAPHVGLTWWCPMNVQNRGHSGGPGIVEVCAGKLDVVKLGEADLMRLGKVEGFGTGDAFKGDANAAQKV